MNQNKKIRFAVVGCGHIGKRHIMMIENNVECELVALCDTRSKDETMVCNYNVPFFRSLEELLDSSFDFDVLCVATPNGLHEEHALQGIKRGHHIVIEKP